MNNEWISVEEKKSDNNYKWVGDENENIAFIKMSLVVFVVTIWVIIYLIVKF